MPSPTQLTLRHLRELGYLAEVVERYNAHSRTRHDLFGMFDVLGLHPVAGILAVQCTSGSHHADRRAKLQGRPELAVWLAAGGRAEVWSWRKKGRAWVLRAEALGEPGEQLPGPGMAAIADTPTDTSPERTRCAHCVRRVACRRGLCRVCHRDPAIRASHPPLADTRSDLSAGDSG